MSAPNLMRADMGNLSGVPRQASIGCPPNRGGDISSADPGGLSILRFGRSLPLIELFETFLIVGLILMIGGGTIQFSYNKISEMLSSQGMTASDASKIIHEAAGTMTGWIILGVIMILVGFAMYYFHRAYGGKTTA